MDISSFILQLWKTEILKSPGSKTPNVILSLVNTQPICYKIFSFYSLFFEIFILHSLNSTLFFQFGVTMQTIILCKSLNNFILFHSYVTFSTRNVKYYANTLNAFTVTFLLAENFPLSFLFD